MVFYLIPASTQKLTDGGYTKHSTLQKQKEWHTLPLNYGCCKGSAMLLRKPLEPMLTHTDTEQSTQMHDAPAEIPANAWEEGDEVVLIACRLQKLNLEMLGGRAKEKLENFTNELYEIRFNMKTSLATQKKLSESAVEFPRVNEYYTGRKQRFVYATRVDSNAKINGILKFDLSAEPESGKDNLEIGGNVQGIYDLGPDRYGSEAVFIPSKLGVESEEDDGYLIFFTHDENTGKSSVIVIDAKTMSPDTVAVVLLSHRVPYGFHAFFLTEEQIQEQAKFQLFYEQVNAEACGIQII